MRNAVGGEKEEKLNFLAMCIQANFCTKALDSKTRAKCMLTSLQTWNHMLCKYSTQISYENVQTQEDQLLIYSSHNLVNDEFPSSLPELLSTYYVCSYCQQVVKERFVTGLPNNSNFFYSCLGSEINIWPRWLLFGLFLFS